MFAKFSKATAAVAAVATTVGIVTATSSQAQLSGSIEIDGSSTVFPITQKMADVFTSGDEDLGVDAIASDVEISVGVSGTGGGFRKFCAGETDISNASRPIKEEEMEACAASGVEYIEVLVGTDALTVVVSESNSFLSDITEEELNMIWSPEAEGTITRWSQVNASWPNAPIRLYGPGTDSGTFDFFTEEINGEGGASRADYTASENDNILVQGIQRDPNAMGYFGLSYFLDNEESLKALSIGGVEPTPDNAKSGEYPLARPLFIYVSEASLEKPEVQAFVEFYLEAARDTDAVTLIGYVPLTEEEYNDSLALVD